MGALRAEMRKMQDFVTVIVRIEAEMGVVKAE